MDEIGSVGPARTAPPPEPTSGVDTAPAPAATAAPAAWSAVSSASYAHDTESTNVRETRSDVGGWANRQADEALDGFAWVGRQYDDLLTQLSGTTAATVKTLGGAQGILAHLNRKEITDLASRTGDIGKDPKAMVTYMENIHNGRFTPGPATKVLGAAASVLEGVTGVLSMASEFNREHSAGNTQYGGTMKNMAKTVAQMSSGYAAGAIVAGAVAGVASAPAVLVVGAGMAAAYGVGKLIDWIGA